MIDPILIILIQTIAWPEDFGKAPVRDAIFWINPGACGKTDP